MGHAYRDLVQPIYLVFDHVSLQCQYWLLSDLWAFLTYHYWEETDPRKLPNSRQNKWLLLGIMGQKAPICRKKRIDVGRGRNEGLTD